MITINQNIILYSTGCIACKTLKLMLDKAGITYTENNSVEEMLSLGFTQLPVLSVDGANMRYDAAKKWVQEHSEGESK